MLRISEYSPICFPYLPTLLHSDRFITLFFQYFHKYYAHLSFSIYILALILRYGSVFFSLVFVVRCVRFYRMSVISWFQFMKHKLMIFSLLSNTVKATMIVIIIFYEPGSTMIALGGEPLVCSLFIKYQKYVLLKIVNILFYILVLSINY